MKKFFYSPYFDKIINSIIAVGVGLTIYFIIDVRDFVKYKQPYRDELQDIKIDELNKYFNQRCHLVDSLNSNKFQNMNKRIDNYKDDIRRIEEKIDKLLLTKYTAEK